MSTTAEQVVDSALSRHYSFRGAGLSDGAAVAELNQIQRRILLDLASTIESLIGTTSEIMTGLDNTFLVALDENGVPYFTTTTEPGYAIRFDGGVPYILANDPIIVDPFGQDGDTPGLPLPSSVLRLIFLAARTPDTLAPIPPRPVEIVKQEVVQKNSPRSGLQAYMIANRIIPVRLSEADLWSQVSSLILAYIETPALTALSDELVVPDPCVPAVIAQLVKFLSMQAEKCPAGDKKQFAIDAATEYESMIQSVNAMDAVTVSSVIYRRR